MTEVATIAPVVKSVQVACDPTHAFDVFTRGIAAWWPLESHAIHRGEVREVIWEGRVGGEVYEISNGGVKAHWATVLAWDPPAGLTIAWNVNPDAVAPTEIEVHFRAEAGGTRVDLEHRHWERLGADAAEARGNYDEGWDPVLARFVAHAG
jgi:uncharacterized protein YndB with AHSA1/START domain